MKQFYNSVLVGFVLLCAGYAQAVADDIRPENIDAMLRADLQLYEFYSRHAQGLDLCRNICPDQLGAVEDASGVLTVLLDEAAAEIRGEHAATIDFTKYDEAIAEAVRSEMEESACTYCERLVEKVQMYGEVGLPDSIARVAFFHAANYAQTPEQEFADGLIIPVQYTWTSAGKEQSCTVSIPRTWGSVASVSNDRKTEYRSALGNGIPFFSIEYTPSPKVSNDQMRARELQRRISLEGLAEEYGDVEILAQGVQKLGATLSSWVMFSTGDDGSDDSGYYYNWYMIVGDTTLSFRSGVTGSGGLPMVEQKYIFRKYYHTLREIALSSVIHQND